MTFLQVAGILISLILYPYIIRTLGKEAYGTYIFIASNISFLSLFIGFGFSLPALKKISLNQNDNNIKSQTVSEVLTSQIILCLFCAIFLAVLTVFIPFVRANKILYFIIFLSTLGGILFPSWYFQGIQKMKFVTYVNLALRLLTIPLIFIFIKSPADLLKYTIIVSGLSFSGGIFTFFYLQIKENIKIRFISIKTLKSVFADALPFFWTSTIDTLKHESITFIIGTFFNMSSVALYDLANKIISIPRYIIYNINSALFPNVMKNHTLDRIKKIMKTERLLSVVVITIIVVFGYWAVLLLGGRNMIGAYPIVVIQSITIFTWLIVGCYLNFIFIPHNKYNLVLKTKLVEIISLMFLQAISILFFNNILYLVVSLVLSELLETLYCYLIVKKNKLI
jgi:PST family polysaccharide transporter